MSAPTKVNATAMAARGTERQQVELGFGFDGPLVSASTRVGFDLEGRFFFPGWDKLESMQTIRDVWVPQSPTRSQFKRVCARYSSARGIFLAELATRLGDHPIAIDGAFSDRATK